ncbi:MAG: hypothetical protein ACPGNV_18250 [Mangrovicoccus sp.]
MDQSRLWSLIGDAATLLPTEPEGLFVPDCWVSPPPNWDLLVENETREFLGRSEDQLRQAYLCAPGQMPMKTGTPWPADRDPPWVEAGMDVYDWVKLAENKPTEPVPEDLLPKYD